MYYRYTSISEGYKTQVIKVFSFHIHVYFILTNEINNLIIFGHVRLLEKKYAHQERQFCVIGIKRFEKKVYVRALLIKILGIGVVE